MAVSATRPHILVFSDEADDEEEEEEEEEVDVGGTAAVASGTAVGSSEGEEADVVGSVEDEGTLTTRRLRPRPSSSSWAAARP